MLQAASCQQVEGHRHAAHVERICLPSPFKLVHMLASSGLHTALQAAQVLEVCRSRGVPLLINDRVDVALAVGADGVHIGQVRF